MRAVPEEDQRDGVVAGRHEQQCGGSVVEANRCQRHGAQSITRVSSPARGRTRRSCTCRLEEPSMHVPLTVLDFIERAELVYGNRAGVVDEPNQPAESLGTLTWSEIGRLARAQAAGLDALGVAQGERVAIVSHNSARLLTSFFGVSAY